MRELAAPKPALRPWPSPSRYTSTGRLRSCHTGLRHDSGRENGGVESLWQTVARALASPGGRLRGAAHWTAGQQLGQGKLLAPPNQQG